MIARKTRRLLLLIKMTHRCVKFDLSDFYSHYKSSCLLCIDDRFETIKDIETFLKNSFSFVEPFYLEASGAWLPDFESVKLIHIVGGPIKIKKGVDSESNAIHSGVESQSNELNINSERKRKRKHSKEIKKPLLEDMCLENSANSLKIEPNIRKRNRDHVITEVTNPEVESQFQDAIVEEKAKKKKKKHSKKSEKCLDQDMSASNCVDGCQIDDKIKKEHEKQLHLSPGNLYECYQEPMLEESGIVVDKVIKSDKKKNHNPVGSNNTVDVAQFNSSLSDVLNNTDTSITSNKRKRVRIRRRKKVHDGKGDVLSRFKEKVILKLDSMSADFRWTTPKQNKQKHIRFESDDESKSIDNRELLISSTPASGKIDNTVEHEDRSKLSENNLEASENLKNKENPSTFNVGSSLCNGMDYKSLPLLDKSSRNNVQSPLTQRKQSTQNGNHVSGDEMSKSLWDVLPNCVESPKPIQNQCKAPVFRKSNSQIENLDSGNEVTGTLRDVLPNCVGNVTQSKTRYKVPVFERKPKSRTEVVNTTEYLSPVKISNREIEKCKDVEAHVTEEISSTVSPNGDIKDGVVVVNGQQSSIAIENNATGASEELYPMSDPRIAISVGDFINFQVMYINSASMPTLSDEIVGKVLSMKDKLTLEIISGTVTLGISKGKFSLDENNDVHNYYPTGIVELSYNDLLNPRKIASADCEQVQNISVTS